MIKKITFKVKAEHPELDGINNVAAKAKLLEFDDVIQSNYINNTIGKYGAVKDRYLA